MKIGSIVVTFNRKELLLENINSQLSQDRIPDYIFIIDNSSTDGTEEYIKGNINDKRVIYLNTGSNLGGAGGFNFGIKKAFEYDVDALLLMDDDGRMFDNETLTNLEQYVLDNNINFYCLNSLVICDEEHLSFSLGKEYDNLKVSQIQVKYKVINDAINPFNGTLISRELYEKIGNVNIDFFIKGDEVDYMNRALQNSAVVRTITNSLYFHPSVNNKVKTLFNKTICGLEAPWKEYYSTRNQVYTYRYSLVKRCKIYIKKIIKSYITKNKDPKILRKFIKKGYKDGVKGKLGKTILPGQTTL